MCEEIQIKSKQRVKDHGEVFTNPREVNAMLDLVKEESYKVDSRFLEPACGNGNFLVEILNRKLETINKEYKANQADWEKYTFIAIGSIYAIDIQKDNCEESKARMYKIVNDQYMGAYPENQNSDFLKTIRYLLDKNIIHGDGLTGLQEKTKDPIIFSEWNIDDDNITKKDYVVTRKDFTMNDMATHGRRAAAKEEKLKSKESNLFNMGIIQEKDEELQPVKTYQPINFLEAYKLEQQY